MRITNSMITDRAIQQMSQSLESLNKAQYRAAAGKAFEYASDDPVSASMSMSLRSSLRSIENFGETTSYVGEWMTATDFALQQIVDVAGRANSLMSSGLNDTLDADNRKNSLAPEIDALISQVIEMGNTTHDSQYLFSGSAVDVKPFKITEDADYNDPVSGHFKVEYLGNSKAMQRAINADQNVTLNVDGSDIVGLLKVLVQAREALKSNDTSTLRESLSGLESAQTSIDKLRQSNGVRMRQVQVAQDYLDKARVETSSLLSKHEDMNLAEGITLLTKQENTYKAVLQVAQRSISTMNLFDYLQ